MNNADVIKGYSKEIKDILTTVVDLPMDAPGILLEQCMGWMARCTQIHVDLSHMELRDRSAKIVRTLELKPVMDLIEFIFKGASRLTEIRRQELDMSR